METDNQDVKAIRSGYLFIGVTVLLMATIIPVVIHSISLEARPIMFHHRHR